MQTKKKLVLKSDRDDLILDVDLLALIHVEPDGEVSISASPE